MVLGGPGRRCGALIKPGCGAVGFHVEAREGDGLCGMLAGDGCCSCLLRRLFVNYKETNPKNVFRYLHQSNCQARGGPPTRRGGALKPFSKFYFGCNLTRRFCVCGFVRSFDFFAIECLQTFLISTLIKGIESKAKGGASLVLAVYRSELAL